MLPLFAYGTLTFPEVISVVIGRVPSSQPAEIHGYKNCCVRGKSFPGLIYAGRGVVRGVLYFGLTGDDWAKLNAFEDEFYQLEQVGVITEHVSQPAKAYIVPPQNAAVLTSEIWDPEIFRRDFLPHYLSGTINPFSNPPL